MKESEIQKKIIAYLNFKGCYSIKTITTNRSGSPDIICCYKGLFVALEIKADKGRVSKLQSYHLEQIKKSGGVAAIVRSVEDTKKVFEDIEDEEPKAVDPIDYDLEPIEFEELY